MKRMALARIAWAGVLGLLACVALAREPADTSQFHISGTTPLPETATLGSRPGYMDFHVDPARPSDLGNVSTHGIPAWTIRILDGTDSWDGPTSLPPPRTVVDAPAKLRDRIALFQVESSMQGGWIVVPRGWRVTNAAAGAQGSWGVIFVAQGGPQDGWLLVGASGPGMTEVFSGAEGYFPGAYRLENAIIPHALAGDVSLTPRPASLTHPNRCTALVTYKSGGLAVKGMKQLGDDGISGFSIALPPDEAALQNFLFAAFRRTHPLSMCPKNIMDW